MSDLIDRRETMQALVAEYNRRFMAGDRGGLKMAWIEKAVDDVPSAQPEIIYCKDCKHWYLDADTGMACEFTNMGQPEDGFCNWAERGQDE